MWTDKSIHDWMDKQPEKYIDELNLLNIFVYGVDTSINIMCFIYAKLSIYIFICEEIEYMYIVHVLSVTM